MRELKESHRFKESHRLDLGRADKEATVLNRVVGWTADGFEYVADPRQAENFLRELKLDGVSVKIVGSPSVKPTRKQLDGDQLLEAGKTTPYRAVVARAQYLSSDRPEVHFGMKEAVGCPRPQSWR